MDQHLDCAGTLSSDIHRLDTAVSQPVVSQALSDPHCLRARYTMRRSAHSQAPTPYLLGCLRVAACVAGGAVGSTVVLLKGDSCAPSNNDVIFCRAVLLLGHAGAGRSTPVCYARRKEHDV